MTTTICACEQELSAPDLDALVGVALDHFSGEHPDLGLAENNVRNFLEAEARLDGPSESVASLREVRTLPISVEYLDEILEFFDRRAFVGNPAWAMCYCVFHHMGGSNSQEFRESTWQQNRERLKERIKTGAISGVLAFSDGVLAGWCNVSPRSEFADRSTGEVGEEKVGAIVCSVVAPPFRNKGLQRTMLAAAIELMRDMGMVRVEAYPNPSPQDEASAYPGWPERYQSFGFQTISEDPLVLSLDL